MKTIVNALFVLIIIMACDADNDLCLKGSGDVNDYTLELDSFDEVKLTGPVNLRITQGMGQEVIVMAEPEMYQHLSYRVINKRLEIGYEDNIKCFDTNFGVWINVTVPDINAVSVEGASEIRSSGDLTLDKLAIDISGTGDIEITGNVDEQIINVAGTINLNNFELSTETTEITIAGAGTLEVAVEELLDITVSGAATIRYKGNPQIKQDISGTLNLENAN